MYVEATQPVNASEILTRVSFRLLSYLIYTLLVCFGLELFFFFTELLPIQNLTLFLLLFLQSLCYLRIYFLIYDCCKHLTKVYFKIFKQMSPSPDRTWSQGGGRGKAARDRGRAIMAHDLSGHKPSWLSPYPFHIERIQMSLNNFRLRFNLLVQNKFKVMYLI